MKLISSIKTTIIIYLFVAYGIIRTVSDVDADKTYDFHTAFDIQPTKVVYNVNLDTNQKT